MAPGNASTVFDLLRNQIDITRVPFSDRGSRLVVYKHADRNHLYVKLAERLTSVDPAPQAYLQRPPFIDDISFVDHAGTELDFKFSSLPHLVEFQTRIGPFQLAFQDSKTLAFGLPPNSRCGLRFHARELGNIRRLAYSTNGAAVAGGRNNLADGSSIVNYIVQTNEDTSIALHIDDKDHLAHPVRPFSDVRADAESRWSSWFAKLPQVAEPYRQKYAYAWWILANNMVSPSGIITRQAVMPSKASYVGIWLWDCALHAIALRHIDPALARDQIRVMLDHQLPNGMLPDCLYDEGLVTELSHPVTGAVTKPPLLAWAALKLHQAHPDTDFLKEIYEPLVRENAWWVRENDADTDGLVEYSHPYSSGLDNSPLWDHGMPVESPDINTYLCIQMDCLADMAEALGKDDEAETWRQKARKLVRRMLDDLWNRMKQGVFYAVYEELPVKVMTPFNLLPLWTGHLPADVIQKLIGHIQDPTQFWGDFPLPTVAKNDPAYDPENMWRGPVWANVNYFFVEALQNAGEPKLARSLRDKTLAMIMAQPDIREYYSSANGKAPATAAPAFSWTASVFIELALQASADSQGGSQPS